MHFRHFFATAVAVAAVFFTAPLAAQSPTTEIPGAPEIPEVSEVTAPALTPISELTHFELSLPEPWVPKTRYFLGTNLLNLPWTYANLAFEARFPNNFAVVANVYGGVPWVMNFDSDWVESIVGGRYEVRWYVDRNRNFYVGMEAGVMFLIEHSGYGSEVYGGAFTIGGVLGYDLRLGKRFGMEFGMGIGYASWIIPITHMGVSLKWELGKNPMPVRDRR